MKKTAIVIGISIGILIILWYVAKFTNSLAVYNVPSEANEPTIKANSKIWVSRFKKPERFDFIVVRAELERMGRATIVFRLCGLPGDVVEIRAGDLYVNSKLIDSQLDLLNQYKFPVSELSGIQDSVDINQAHMENDSVSMTLSSAFVQRHKLNSVKYVVDKDYENPGISQRFHHSWNEDHFGPIKIPADHYFILGDNRHGAQDSRYVGLIPRADFVATVLN